MFLFNLTLSRDSMHHITKTFWWKWLTFGARCRNQRISSFCYSVVVKPKVSRFTLGSLPFLSGKSPIGGAQEATEPLGQITSTSPAPPCGILAVFFQWTREVDPIQKRWRYGCRSSLESYMVKLGEEARWTMFMLFSSLQKYVTFGTYIATEVSVFVFVNGWIRPVLVHLPFSRHRPHSYKCWQHFYLFTTAEWNQPLQFSTASTIHRFT